MEDELRLSMADDDIESQIALPPSGSPTDSSRKYGRTEKVSLGMTAGSGETAETGGRMVSAAEYLEPSTPDASTVSRPGLRDWAKLVKRSDRFSEVSLEQIERIRIVHDGFMEGCHFSFNYNILLLVASVIAGLGLVSDSTATIIASMLVSPIMGPVVGMAYGTCIFDMKMVRHALFTEVVSLIFCIIIGFIIAACTGKTALADDWPTDEMLSRATLQNLYVSLPVAFFSGLGVSVSLLDQQTSSLVGVAISASLLPPAVNAGIIWVAYFFEKRDGVGTEYTHEDFREAGVISLSITLANIVLVCISSILMFRIKEKLPIKKKPFWDDLGVARNIYRNRAFFMNEGTSTESTRDENPKLVQTTTVTADGDTREVSVSPVTTRKVQ